MSAAPGVVEVLCVLCVAWHALRPPPEYPPREAFSRPDVPAGEPWRGYP